MTTAKESGVNPTAFAASARNALERVCPGAGLDPASRIVEDWSVTDTLGMLRQLGLWRSLAVAVKSWRNVAVAGASSRSHADKSKATCDAR